MLRMTMIKIGGIPGAARASKPVQVQVHVEVMLAQVLAEQPSELMVYLAAAQFPGGGRKLGRVSNGKRGNCSMLKYETVLESHRRIADAGSVNRGIVLKAVAAKAKFKVARKAEFEQALQLLQAGRGGYPFFNFEDAALRGVGRVGNRRTVGHGSNNIARRRLLANRPN